MNVGAVRELGFGLDRLVEPDFHDMQDPFVVHIELHAVRVCKIEIEKTIVLYRIKEASPFSKIVVQKLRKRYGVKLGDGREIVFHQ